MLKVWNHTAAIARQEVTVYNYLEGGTAAERAQFEGGMLLVDWHETPVPAGLHSRELMDTASVDELRVIDRLVEGPPGFALCDVFYKNGRAPTRHLWEAPGSVEGCPVRAPARVPLSQVTNMVP